MSGAMSPGSHWRGCGGVVVVSGQWCCARGPRRAAPAPPAPSLRRLGRGPTGCHRRRRPTAVACVCSRAVRSCCRRLSTFGACRSPTRRWPTPRPSARASCSSTARPPARSVLIVWGDTTRVHYELIVEPGVTTLEQRMQELFPGEDIRVGVADWAVILSGKASTNEVMLRAGELATTEHAGQEGHQHAATARRWRQSAGHASGARGRGEQARPLQSLACRCSPTRAGFTGRSTTQQFAAPDFDDQAGGHRRDGVQRLPEPLLLPAKRGHRRRDEGARAEREPGEPGRAEPDCLQRAGSLGARWRRNSRCPWSAARPATCRSLERIRRAAEVQSRRSPAT